MKVFRPGIALLILLAVSVLPAHAQDLDVGSAHLAIWRTEVCEPEMVDLYHEGERVDDVYDAGGLFLNAFPQTLRPGPYIQDSELFPGEQVARTIIVRREFADILLEDNRRIVGVVTVAVCWNWLHLGVERSPAYLIARSEGAASEWDGLTPIAWVDKQLRVHIY